MSGASTLLIGGGGREHALAWRLGEGGSSIVAAPGNPGLAQIARTTRADVEDTASLVSLARSLGSGLVVVGPEAPLAAGLVDALADAGIPAFGPTREAAQLEWSKAWAKDFFRRHEVPTARAETVDSLEGGRAAARRFGLPVVIKADGLAAGKGVTVATTVEAAEEALRALFAGPETGEQVVVVEEYLEGRELSVLAFCDSERLSVMPPARDYKPLLEGNRGPNTGGMGGYTRPPDATPELLSDVVRAILQPTLQGMAQEGRPYRGVLYAGLMLTADGPRVLEFNCRFGDPETQLLMPLFAGDLRAVCESCARGELDENAVRWREGSTCGVVMAAEGYPAGPRLGEPLEILSPHTDDVFVFQAGSKLAEDGTLVTAGGRVATVVGRGQSLEQARQRAYQSVDLVRFSGRTYRTDIGLLT